MNSLNKSHMNARTINSGPPTTLHSNLLVRLAENNKHNRCGSEMRSDMAAVLLFATNNDDDSGEESFSRERQRSRVRTDDDSI